MEHMALSRPDISFTFQINRQTRFSTSGSGDLKEVIYRIYGREIAKEIFPFEASDNGFSVKMCIRDRSTPAWNPLRAAWKF